MSPEENFYIAWMLAGIAMMSKPLRILKFLDYTRAPRELSTIIITCTAGARTCLRGMTSIAHFDYLEIWFVPAIFKIVY